MLSFAPYEPSRTQDGAAPTQPEGAEASEELVCPACSVRFASAESRRVHDLSRHNWPRKSQAERAAMPLDRAFQTAWDIPEGAEKFPCPFCQQEFSRRPTVSVHFHDGRSGRTKNGTVMHPCSEAYRTWRQAVEDGNADAPFPVVEQTVQQKRARAGCDRRMAAGKRHFVEEDEWRRRSATRPAPVDE